MKPLTRLELIALVPALAAMKRDAALAQLDAHITKRRIVVNDDGSIDVDQLEELYDLDREHAPKDDAAKADLLGRRIAAIDAELEVLQSKMAPLLEEKELLKARRADFAPPPPMLPAAPKKK